MAALMVRCGRETIAVGDLFEVSGDGGQHLVVGGDLHRVDGIGTGMSRGRILVEGTCGDHLGARMSGGEIDVAGDVGAWAGGEMSGGLCGSGGMRARDSAAPIRASAPA